MKMKDLIEGDVVPLNRKLKGEMSAGDFMRALTPKEFEALMDFPEGDNLYDQVVDSPRKIIPMSLSKMRKRFRITRRNIV